MDDGIRVFPRWHPLIQGGSDSAALVLSAAHPAVGGAPNLGH